MSFLSRVWNTFRNPLRYVGRDLEGNKFFEHPSSTSDPRRTKRTVQYRKPDDVWNYIGGAKRLPIQWSAWLTHTRRHPPTLEELQTDVERQRRVLANAAMIESRETDQREQARRLDAPLQRDIPQYVTELPVQATATPPARNEDLQPEEVKPAKQPSPQPLKSPWKQNTNPEPEAWIPTTRRRRESR